MQAVTLRQVGTLMDDVTETTLGKQSTCLHIIGAMHKSELVASIALTW